MKSQTTSRTSKTAHALPGTDLRRVLAFACLAALTIVLAVPAHAQKEDVVYSFESVSGDGLAPEAPVVTVTFQATPQTATTLWLE